MASPNMKRREFTKEEVAEVLDTLGEMHECAIDREDKKDEKALAVAMTATRILLGDGKNDASCPWPKEE